MRSTAETRKDGPLAHYSSSGAGSGVVLRHLAAAAACACLTVDTAAAEALHAVGRSPDWASAIRCTTIAQIQGVLQMLFFYHGF